MVQTDMILAGKSVNGTANLLSSDCLMGSSMTIRDGSFGQAFITHMYAVSTGATLSECKLTFPGQTDSNGVEVPIQQWAAANGFSLEDTKLDVPIPVAPNTTLVPSVTTGGAQTVFFWACVQYSGGGFQPAPSPQCAGGHISRKRQASGALTTMVEAAQTDISDLVSGTQYQVIGTKALATTNVGPLFVKIWGPSSFNGMNFILPIAGTELVNVHQTVNLARAKIPSPVFGMQNVKWSLVDFTAEQPTISIDFAVSVD